MTIAQMFHALCNETTRTTDKNIANQRLYRIRQRREKFVEDIMRGAGL